MRARLLVDSNPLRVQHCEMERDGGADAHVHDAEDQVIVVVGGALNVGVARGEAQVTAAEGDAVYVPAGTSHATNPADDRGATYLVLTFPPAKPGD